jgi:hypothetical protein
MTKVRSLSLGEGTMRRAIQYVLLGVATIGGSVAPVRADVTAEQVREAIDRAVAFLKRQQTPDGSFRPGYEQQRGGVTALCTLALLNAGVAPDDEHVRRALDYLEKIRPEKTYVVSLQTMAFAKADPERYRSQIARNVAWLEKTQITRDDATRGAWSYPGRSGDPSNSQFALLALHEAERMGVRADAQTWRLAEKYWKGIQKLDGSWPYFTEQAGPGIGSMTCAGISSLVITSDKAYEGNAGVDGDRIQCCRSSESDDSRIQDGIRDGLDWLGRNFAVGTNPGRGDWHLFYYLYGLERVGRLTARRFIGGHDWYREGAEALLRMKGGAVTDHWVGVSPDEQKSVIATSFALLFLSKGRRPILLSKLKHGAGDDWNAHRSDVNNLTRYVETRWEQDMTWQVVDLKAATVEDLLESPVLYLCGRENPVPRSAAAQEETARKLRDYLDRDGFLFAEAYAGGTDFDQGFRAFVNERVFPEREYRLVPLPLEHPIWRTAEAVDAAYVRLLWGVEFGCRTSLVYAPPDTSADGGPSLSCLWELSRSGRDQKFQESVQKQIDAALSIGNNVLAYATNQQLKYKNPARPEPLAGTARDQFPRGRLYIANVRHMGGCDAAPRALVTLLETAGRERNMRVGAEKREVALTDAGLFDYHLVFMHGRNSFHLTDPEREKLRTYVERGGMVFANAICASRYFTQSFRREMEATFPDRPLKPIPQDDPLYSSSLYGGYDLSTVTRRDPGAGSRSGTLEPLLRKLPPELEAIRVGERYGVIFSPYDLSCALERHDSPECPGYVREDAARIGLNVLLYSLQQ